MDTPSSSQKDRNEEVRASATRAATRQYAHYATVGIMFPVAIALGFAGGYYLDRWLGTVPLFAVIGLGLGFASAIRNLLQTVARDERG